MTGKVNKSIQAFRRYRGHKLQSFSVFPNKRLSLARPTRHTRFINKSVRLVEHVRAYLRLIGVRESDRYVTRQICLPDYSLTLD